MRRFHVHVHVAELDASVRFYSTLFGEQPTVVKADYAKWLLQDPRVNFAISSGATKPTIDHLGFQVESDEELVTIAERLDSAGQLVIRQENATCCYARGNKRWVNDPSGISWETFHTFGESTFYGDDTLSRPPAVNMQQTSEACCVPSAQAPGACCSAPKAQ